MDVSQLPDQNSAAYPSGTGMIQYGSNGVWKGQITQNDAGDPASGGVVVCFGSASGGQYIPPGLWTTLGHAGMPDQLPAWLR